MSKKLIYNMLIVLFVLSIFAGCSSNNHENIRDEIWDNSIETYALINDNFQNTTEADFYLGKKIQSLEHELNQNKFDLTEEEFNLINEVLYLYDIYSQHRNNITSDLKMSQKRSETDKINFEKVTEKIKEKYNLK